MAIREPDWSTLEREIRGLREFLEGELVPLVERMGERRAILFYSLHHDHLRLKEPLAVFVEHDGQQVIASCFDLDVFGYGDTESEALADLRQTVVDLYLELKESEGKRGPLPEKVWSYLASVVEEM